MSRETTIIIGGGVIGLSTAYQLARRNSCRIILIEKGTLGSGSSSRAAGIGTQLMWSETGILARRLGFQIFRELSDEWEDFTFCGQHGCLNLFTPEGWNSRQDLLPLYDRLDAPYSVLDAKEIHRRWPALTPPSHLIGLHDPRGGYSEPAEYLSALSRRVRELGVEVYEGEKVEEFLRRGDKVVGVRTSTHSFEAEHVVSTVHVWSLPLWRELFFRVPIKHFVHQRYLSSPLDTQIDLPPVNADPYFGYVRPAVGNRLLMGVETPDRDEVRVESLSFEMTEVSAEIGTREAGQRRLCELLPALQNVEWENSKVGLISFSMDGEPLLGAIRELPGLFVAASFHSGGYSYSAVAGFLMAELVSEGRTRIDIGAFSPSRFEHSDTERHLSTTIPQKSAIRRRH